MKATELRIGNLVFGIDDFNHGKKVIDTIAVITQYRWETIKGFNGIEPIPLTEEWLIKFGAKKVKGIGDKYWYSIILFDEVENWNKPFIYYSPDNDYAELLDSEHEERITVIKYVHQLQNLYFALTGEELELK